MIYSKPQIHKTHPNINIYTQYNSCTNNEISGNT